MKSYKSNFFYKTTIFDIDIYTLLYNEFALHLILLSIILSTVLFNILLTTLNNKFFKLIVDDDVDKVVFFLRPILRSPLLYDIISCLVGTCEIFFWCVFPFFFFFLIACRYRYEVRDFLDDIVMTITITFGFCRSIIHTKRWGYPVITFLFMVPAFHLFDLFERIFANYPSIFHHNIVFPFELTAAAVAVALFVSFFASDNYHHDFGCFPDFSGYI